MPKTKPAERPPTDWDDPETCPFCHASLPDGGPGFISHIDDHPRCRRDFDQWRENVAGDIKGEWAG